jgi:hypothetical protein
MLTISPRQSRFDHLLSLLGSSFRYQYKRLVISGILFAVAMLIATGAISRQAINFIPNGTPLSNPGGASETYSTIGGGIDQTGPFFQSLGTNGRSYASCRQDFAGCGAFLREPLRSGADARGRIGPGGVPKLALALPSAKPGVVLTPIPSRCNSLTAAACGPYHG